MSYEIAKVIITKCRKHDGVDKPLVSLNTKEEIDELRVYLSEIWNKEIRKVSSDDKIEIDFLIVDKTNKT